MVLRHFFKKSLLIVLLLLFEMIHSASIFGASWNDPENIDTSWYSDLSESLEITTPEQFAGFAFLCNNNVSFEGKTVNIMADIDMGDFQFPMCQYFAGTFNGNGYTISNIIIKVLEKNLTYGNCGALFITIGISGKVINARFFDVTVNILGGHDNYAGGIAYENYGVISDCSFNGSAVAANKRDDPPYHLHAGGIVCHNYGTVVNCTNIGEVKAETYNGLSSFDGYVGGIAALNEGLIANCINYGEPYGYFGYGVRWTQEGYVGGICGYSTGRITNVVNMGSITGATEKYVVVYVDGICAYGSCTNSYYSSSAKLTGENISKHGTLLSLEQIQNNALDFTSLLNTNVYDTDFSPKTYWTNSPDYNNNEPFLLNSPNLNLQCVKTTQSSISIECRPLQLTSSWIIEKGFEYSKKGSGIVNAITVDNPFSADIIGLEAENHYDIRAYIKGKTGIVYSKSLSVQTTSLNIQTLEATNISPVSAVLNGKLNIGNTPIKSQGFVWKETNGHYNVIQTQGFEFSAKIDNLKPSTTYIYQAFAIDENDKSMYGEEVNFKTNPIIISIDDIKQTPNTIRINGHLNLEFCAEVVVQYHEINDNNFVYKKVISESDGTYCVTLSDLFADSEYEIRTYFAYDNFTFYSSTERISTLPIEIKTLAPYVGGFVEFYGEKNGNSKGGEYGFEYREKKLPDVISSKTIVCSVEDNRFIARPSELINGTDYKVRAYYKAPTNKYSYGQWQEFTPTKCSSVDGIETDKDLKIVAIFNIFGQRISSCSKGINIILYSDGSVKKVTL